MPQEPRTLRALLEEYAPARRNCIISARTLVTLIDSVIDELIIEFVSGLSSSVKADVPGSKIEEAYH
jgi:hypothetical protein